MGQIENRQKVVGIITKKPEVAAVFSNSLKRRNFTPVVFETKKDLHTALEDSSPDALILSARNALGLSEEARKIPRIEAVSGETEKDERKIITHILNSGAWSYVATRNENPQDVADLAAAKINRLFSSENTRNPEPPIVIDNIWVDLEHMLLKVDGEARYCPPTALKILGLIIKNPDVPISKQAVKDCIGKEILRDETFNQYVSSLRRILGSEKRHVEKIRGAGLKFTTNPKKV